MVILEDLRKLIELCSKAMPPGVHCHMFCAWIRVGGWHQTLLGLIVEVTSNEHVEGEECVIQKPLFGAETNALRYKRALENHTSDPKEKQIGPSSVDEIEINIWRPVLRPFHVFNRSNCQP